MLFQIKIQINDKCELEIDQKDFKRILDVAIHFKINKKIKGGHTYGISKSIYRNTGTA